MRAKGSGKYGARGWRKTGRSFRPDVEAVQETPKKFSKTVTDPKTGRKRTVKYGAKGYSIAPGTKKVIDTVPVVLGHEVSWQGLLR